MSAWTLCVLLLCARPADPRHRDPDPDWDRDRDWDRDWDRDRDREQREAPQRHRDLDWDRDRPMGLQGLEGVQQQREAPQRHLSLSLPRDQDQDRTMAGLQPQRGWSLSLPQQQEQRDLPLDRDWVRTMGEGLQPQREGPGLRRGGTPPVVPEGPNPGPGARGSRGSKGSWRRRVHVTSGPDRYFTSTEPPQRDRAPPGPPGLSGPPGLPGPPLWSYLLLVLGLVLLSLGLVGNLSLLCLVWNSLGLQTVWNCVLAGLALWDLLVLFFCLPVHLLHQLTGTNLMGALSCSLLPFLEVSSMGVATFSLSALSIARFHSATSPAPRSAHVDSCASILPKISVVFVGAFLLATPELLLYRRVLLPPQDGPSRYSHYSPQLDVCLAEPSPELPLAVLSLVVTYQEARPWWVFGCYLCLPLLFTLSCDLVTQRVTSPRAPQPIGRQEAGSLSSSPSAAKKDVVSNRSSSPSASRQEVCSRTSSLKQEVCSRTSSLKQEVCGETSSANRKQGAGQRSVILALIGLYVACTLPDAACSLVVMHLPALPGGVAEALRLIGRMLLFTRCAATPLIALRFSKALGGAFVHCCCCCCEDTPTTVPDTPTADLDTPIADPDTPSTLLATPLSAVAPPLRDTPPEQQAALGTPC